MSLIGERVVFRKIVNNPKYVYGDQNRDNNIVHQVVGTVTDLIGMIVNHPDDSKVTAVITALGDIHTVPAENLGIFRGAQMGVKVVARKILQGGGYSEGRYSDKVCYCGHCGARFYGKKVNICHDCKCLLEEG